MEKGKLHKAGKDSSKRGRQVSGTWGGRELGRGGAGGAGQQGGAGWGVTPHRTSPMTHGRAPLPADAGAVRHA